MFKMKSPFITPGKYKGIFFCGIQIPWLFQYKDLLVGLLALKAHCASETSADSELR